MLRLDFALLLLPGLFVDSFLFLAAPPLSSVFSFDIVVHSSGSRKPETGYPLPGHDSVNFLFPQLLHREICGAILECELLELLSSSETDVGVVAANEHMRRLCRVRFGWADILEAFLL
jgi:hypothetical protein